MNFKRKLLLFLISLSLILPFNVLALAKYVIPGGENIGIRVFADGVYVVDFYKVNKQNIAYDAGFRIGDRIISINSETISNVNDLINKINSDEDYLNINIGLVRNNVYKNIPLTLKRSSDGSYKTGLYVKDSITGIGTLTYIDPETNTFGALGHEITDTNNKFDFIIKYGNIYQANVESIKKAKNNIPGEKNAKIDAKKIIGDINENNTTGIYGKYLGKTDNLSKVEVANIDDVKIGKAEIITVLKGTNKKSYDIEILSIDKKNATKNFVIKITDDELLKNSGGIVKGMSGSPIMQNGKIIGAVTHTLVDNPQKGYGISIMKMLEEE